MLGQRCVEARWSGAGPQGDRPRCFPGLLASDLRGYTQMTRRRRPAEPNPIQWAEWSRLGPRWRSFRDAWLDHGFAAAPTQAQRDMLWPIVDARTDIGDWIRESKGKTVHHVVADILARWDAIRDGVREREERADLERDVGRGGEPGLKAALVQLGSPGLLRLLEAASTSGVPRTRSRPASLRELLGPTDHRPREGGADDGPVGAP